MDASNVQAGTSHQLRFICACSAYNFGRPHVVSSATWYRHLQEAPEQERQRIRDRKFDGLTPPPTRRARGGFARRRNGVLNPHKRASRGTQPLAPLDELGRSASSEDLSVQPLPLEPPAPPGDLPSSSSLELMVGRSREPDEEETPTM